MNDRARYPYPPGVVGEPRVKLYPGAGLRCGVTIQTTDARGRATTVEHRVSAHRASRRDPWKVPASAWCRTCTSHDCLGCAWALARVHEYRDDRDGPRDAAAPNLPTTSRLASATEAPHPTTSHVPSHVHDTR